MRPHTAQLPKALLPVAGEPFAGHQLSWLARQGVTKVLYCIGFLGDQIRAFVGDGSRWGVEVGYVDEGTNLQGTGGAVRLAVDSVQLTSDAFLLAYGDSYLDVEVRSVWRSFTESGQPALMVVWRNDGRLGASNAIYEDGRVTRYDKLAPADVHASMNYIDYGLSVFTQAVIRKRIPAGKRADLGQLQAQLSGEGRLAGFLAERPFYEVGSVAGWRSLEAHLDRLRAEQAST